MSLTKWQSSLRNTKGNGEVMFIERQTKDYQQDFSTTTDHEEYGV
jgi:hypothetical protein